MTRDSEKESYYARKSFDDFVGALPERSSVGHGSRRLFSGRQRVGILPARYGAQPGVSMGRGWVSGNLRRNANSLFRIGAMEWARLDSKRAPIRTNQPRRKSRGRCQGILLLPGCDTNALLLE